MFSIPSSFLIVGKEKKQFLEKKSEKRKKS
jgi:hypothetical protein